jgi:3-phosphoshikimate 1-carboxyvinyltransferase
VQIDGDTITVAGGLLTAPNSTLCSHGDHRIVMALSVLCCAVGGTIDGAQAVDKSMPDFFKKLESLGVKVKYYENE